MPPPIQNLSACSPYLTVALSSKYSISFLLPTKLQGDQPYACRAAMSAPNKHTSHNNNGSYIHTHTCFRRVWRRCSWNSAMLLLEVAPWPSPPSLLASWTSIAPFLCVSGVGFRVFSYVCVRLSLRGLHCLTLPVGQYAAHAQAGHGTRGEERMTTDQVTSAHRREHDPLPAGQAVGLLFVLVSVVL
jgi:hypothetical protein